MGDEQNRLQEQHYSHQCKETIALLIIHGDAEVNWIGRFGHFHLDR